MIVLSCRERIRRGKVVVCLLRTSHHEKVARSNLGKIGSSNASTMIQLPERYVSSSSNII